MCGCGGLCGQCFTILLHIWQAIPIAINWLRIKMRKSDYVDKDGWHY